MLANSALVLTFVYSHENKKISSRNGLYIKKHVKSAFLENVSYTKLYTKNIVDSKAYPDTYFFNCLSHFYLNY